MHTTTIRTKWHGFPRSSRQSDAIAGSRRNDATRVVRPVRPESGRRPDDVGLPGDPCVLCWVPATDGRLYFALAPHAYTGPLLADSDAEAIALARERCGPFALACDTMMEDAARAAGVPITPLSEEQLTLLTVLAVIPAITETMTPTAVEGCDVMRYLFACAGFAWAQVWRTELVTRLYEVETSGRGPRERFDLVIQPEGFDPGPGFGLLESGVELAIDATLPGVTNAIGNGRLTLVCTKSPERLRPLLTRALGTDLFPIGISYRHETARLNASEVCLLTGILECISDLTSGAESATVEIDRRRISIARHPHDALLVPQTRGTA